MKAYIIATLNRPYMVPAHENIFKSLGGKKYEKK